MTPLEAAFQTVTTVRLFPAAPCDPWEKLFQPAAAPAAQGEITPDDVWRPALQLKPQPATLVPKSVPKSVPKPVPKPAYNQLHGSVDTKGDDRIAVEESKEADACCNMCWTAALVPPSPATSTTHSRCSLVWNHVAKVATVVLPGLSGQTTAVATFRAPDQHYEWWPAFCDKMRGGRTLDIVACFEWAAGRLIRVSDIRLVGRVFHVVVPRAKVHRPTRRNKKKSNNQNWRKKPGAGMPAYGFIYKVSLFPRNLYFRLQDVYEHKPVQKHMVVACVVSRGDNVCKGSREWARCVRPLWSMRLATLAFR
jgi:hypothetical protein